MSLSTEPVKPQRIAPEQHERIWGSTQLEPWFPNPSGKVGEVWFREPASSVLVKFIFATENLSVQVHPDDALAQQLGHPCGKTEMWHILRTEPEAQIALGFRSPVTPDQVRRAAADGSIMDLVRWIPVFPGQTWFVPAGTVHAIGAGVALCEVQQNSDLTYRLFDYGRGRELHLDQSMRALNLGSQDPQPQPTGGVLVECPFFQVSRIDVAGQTAVPPSSLAIALAGSGTLGGLPFREGEVFATGGNRPLQLTGRASVLSVLTKTSEGPDQARSQGQP